MRKTQEEKDLEYFEKMKVSIIDDLKRWRHPSAIMWSINRTTDWWKNKLQWLHKEYFPEKQIELTEFEILTEFKLKYMIENKIFPFDWK